MSNTQDLNRIELFDKTMGRYITNEFRQFLINKGFFNAPASTKYHGNYFGGLFDHSYNVTKELCNLTKHSEWQVERSPYIVGMFHDLCKIDSYAYNEDKQMFEHNNDVLIDGHGSKSIIYLSRYINLTEEEALCIRWHMGAFDDKENWNYYTKAVQKYENVLWTHTADMVVSQVMGV